MEAERGGSLYHLKIDEIEVFVDISQFNFNNLYTLSGLSDDVWNKTYRSCTLESYVYIPWAALTHEQVRWGSTCMYHGALRCKCMLTLL